MYRVPVLLIFATIYFGMHVINGYLECDRTFCPGDNPRDWVYEFRDNDGKRFVVVDGTPIPRDVYDQKFEAKNPGVEDKK